MTQQNVYVSIIMGKNAIASKAATVHQVYVVNTTQNVRKLNIMKILELVTLTKL